ncbi:hypothetical protein Tco_1386556 [Tanacetum coccineum]
MHITSRLIFSSNIKYMPCLPIFVDILVHITWLMRMFPLLLPQHLMIKYYHLLHGCLLERVLLSWIFKRSKGSQSFRSLWIFCKTQTSLVAFTTLASVPAIYIQQFWNTLTYEAKTRAYSFQLDENCTNDDYAELIWEEFVQAILTFLADKANLGIEEHTTFTKGLRLHFILLKKITDLEISSSSPKAKKIKYLECKFLRS